MNLRTCTFLFVAALLTTGEPLAAAPAPEWKAGVATRNLTPSGPIWLAGYASRTAPSTGVIMDVFGKALALDDGKGGRVVMVTLDLVGISGSLRDHVAGECAKKFGLKPNEILLNASHTHSAPQVTPDRMALERTFSRAKKAEVDVVNEYQVFLQKTLVELIGEALRSTASANLEFSQARAGFAMNRRRPLPAGGFDNDTNPSGPVDHDVPVLKVTGQDGKIKAIVFGYACHNTTISANKISGDYAGYAQHYLQESYPGATAMFMMGCGGDQNPYPRRNMVPNRPVEELVKDHGRALANSVATALNSPLRRVAGPLRAAYDHAALEYQTLSDEDLKKYLNPQNTPPLIQRAQSLIQQRKAGQRPAPLACPVQVVQFGKDLTLVAIGGEVVVDYSLRIKKELKGSAAVWVAGYSNNVFGYLASRRVIEEGGYEGGGANIRILNHPGPFALDTEEKIVGKVRELHRRVSR